MTETIYLLKKNVDNYRPYHELKFVSKYKNRPYHELKFVSKYKDKQYAKGSISRYDITKKYADSNYQCRICRKHGHNRATCPYK
jgi:hypothetical protein